MPDHGFSETRLFPQNDRIADSLLIQGNKGNLSYFA